MQEYGPKYFSCRAPSLDPRDGVNRSNSTFSEHGHVAYQIKGNHGCTNMVVNILPADTPPPPTLGMSSIGQKSTFSEHGHVAY